MEADNLPGLMSRDLQPSEPIAPDKDSAPAPAAERYFVIPLSVQKDGAFHIVGNADISEFEYARAMNQMLLGLNAACEHDLPFHVRLYPRGEVNGAWWNLVRHCQACNASWPDAEREACQVCGYVGRPASPPKRRARGTRPYWPLERMMGKEKAEEFLAQYEARQREQKMKRG